MKFAFFNVDLKFDFSQLLKYLSNMLNVFLVGLTVNQYVIQIDGTEIV